MNVVSPNIFLFCTISCVTKDFKFWQVVRNVFYIIWRIITRILTSFIDNKVLLWRLLEILGKLCLSVGLEWTNRLFTNQYSIFHNLNQNNGVRYTFEYLVFIVNSVNCCFIFWISFAKVYLAKYLLGEVTI